MREKILILADIHANGPALAAVLGAESDANRILCLGDLVNYGPDPGECLRWARSALRPGDLVRGNHDLLAVSPWETLPSGFPPVSAEVLHQTRARLTREEVDFLRELPPSSNLEVEGQQWHLVHAVPSDPVWGILHPEARPQRWELELALAGFPDVLLVGRTHRPFQIERGGAVVVNPGSVGRPKDGDPRASYAVWEDGRFELKKVEYRIDETAARLRRFFRGSLLEELAGFLRRGGNEIVDREFAA
jgi:putative phosphoesterase